MSESFMVYDQGEGEWKDWIVAENNFAPKWQGKGEVVMALGNGYMGLRSATEESYLGQVRNTFVAGTFNKANDNDVTELPNVADMLALHIEINGTVFSLEKGEFSNYNRSLNLKTGELQRSFSWSFQGHTFDMRFRRFVSFSDLHLLGTEIEIIPRTAGASFLIKSGINGQVTNSGAQHFEEGEKRIFDREFLQMLQTTCESGITFVQNTYHNFSETETAIKSRFEMDRRKVLMIYEAEIQKDKALKFTKLSNIYTTRDKDALGLELDTLRLRSIDQLKEQAQKSFDDLLSESTAAWKKYWDNMQIEVNGKSFDQLVIRFAQYHLMIMAPKHDARYGIGAKGLTGEGYKGHSFWDTEIFLLPFFSYTHPDIARSLLEYRYNTIQGARKKAEENGYRGAMYPWESAWADDGEVTPVWGAVDIVTGEATKIWSGFIEQHITSDVAFAVWQYYQVTGDEDFMEKYGYEILLDTGIFWASRLEWNEEKQEYHINDVVGPDEYKEHVNNDAFTNYTAKWCMENSLRYQEKLQIEKPDLFAELDKKLNLSVEMPLVRERFEKVYLPVPNQDLVIPQDDTYLSLKQIDLTPYKNQKHVGSLFQDYNLHQVNQIQVSKQASVVMLMYLLEHKFSPEIKQANYEYYEPRTLHDSSLSLSTHAILAADIDNLELAYSLFERAARIDLGPKMKTSDHGIHAASLGGIWQILVCGFTGVRMVGGKLRINPKLPQEIQSIKVPLNWKGNRLSIFLSHDGIEVFNQGDSLVLFSVYGQNYQLDAQKSVHINQYQTA